MGYKKFSNLAVKGKVWPKKVNNFYQQNSEKYNIINKDSLITSLGSCFAREISDWLIKHNYTYRKAEWNNVYNSACLQQIVDYSLVPAYYKPIERWWKTPDFVVEPYLKSTIFDNYNLANQWFKEHRKESADIFFNSDVIILTLGLTEVWRNNTDKATFHRCPLVEVYDENIHEFYVQNTHDVFHDLLRIKNLLDWANKNYKLIISVSPVPLLMTFRKDVDIVIANNISKSTLCLAANTFCNSYDNTYYFPSYEYLKNNEEWPYKKDGRHIKEDKIEEIMKLFERMFCEDNNNNKTG